MKKILGLLSISIFTSIFTNAYGANYIVETNHALSLKELKQIKKNYKLKRISSFTTYQSSYFDRLYVVDANKSSVEQLKKSEIVLNIEKDFEAHYFEIKQNPNSQMITNDLLFPKLWGLFNQKQQIVKQLSGKTEVTTGIQGYDIDWKDSIDRIEIQLKKQPVVAVVDMGIDLEHPELVDAIYKNEIECDDGKVPSGSEKEDRDNNKLPGDCHGWNFATTDKLYERFPIDDKGHGTHIAGIIAAKRNNNQGIAGVSDKIKILPIRVTGRVDETSERNKLLIKSPAQRIANGILYAVKMKVDAINLSLGWPKSMDTKFMRNVIAEATRNNIVVVAAAGNNNTNASMFPCAYYDVICVGSINIDGKVSEFSNYGGEVDILAPGDQILSTIPTSFIPLKMNIQGYDILSGTSQAAPFVSATAALLKGVNPEISNDEVMRRIFDSAKDSIEAEKSMHGILQLGKAFQVEPSVSVKPVFKQLSTLVFDGATGRFQFPLNLKNFGTEGTNIKINLKSVSGNIHFLQKDFTIEEMATGRPQSIKVLGALVNPLVDNITKFAVTVSANEMASRTFYHEVVIAKALDKNVFSVGFKFKEKALPLGIFDKEGRLRSNLRTIDSPYSDSNFPDYYLKYQPSDVEESKRGITLYFLQHDGSDYKEIENNIFIKDASKLLQVRKQDFNYDGKDDYLIKTIVTPKDQAGYILYSYRDSSLQPLVGKYSDIRYTPKIANVTPKTVRFTKFKLPNEKFLAKPFFVTEGKLPDEDQVLDPWTRSDLSVRRRIYNLELVDGSYPSYRVRTFMNADFTTKLRQQYEKDFSDLISINDASVEVIQLLHQDKKDFNNGSIKAILSLGVGTFRKNLLLHLTAKKIDHEILSDVTQRLVGSAHHHLVNLDNNQVTTNAQDTFVSFMTSSLLNINNVNIKNVTEEENIPLVYRHRDQADRLVSFIAQFKKDASHFSFLETIDRVLLVKNSSEIDQKIFGRKTRKFSFLPGYQMSEIYYPIVIRNKAGEMLPAIYIDATQVSDNHIYVTTLDEMKQELLAPAFLSSYIPNGCSAMNPVRMKNGNYAYSILCLEKYRDSSRWIVKFWEIVK